ncbi:MAG: 2-oxoacid:acceptor oxidoreductase family protein, partial [Actinomycetes bacterium]|nr:2-oxoacid:acceptor oxidoreductase family protein [Actinomycetes bacterium]
GGVRGGLCVFKTRNAAGPRGVPAGVGWFGAEVPGGGALAGLVLGGHPIVNTAILGAIAAATGLVTLENVAAAIAEAFPAGAAERNVRAAQLAFERTMVSVG